MHLKKESLKKIALNELKPTTSTKSYVPKCRNYFISQIFLKKSGVWDLSFPRSEWSNPRLRKPRKYDSFYDICSLLKRKSRPLP